MKKNSLFLSIFIVLSFFLITNCSSNKQKDDESIVKKKRREVNIDKKTEQQKTSLFGNLGGAGKNTFDFATSNVLWRASLASLDFMPLNTIDYAGGVIISDWYSPNYSNETIKIEVRFTSNELKSSSVNVKAFKKTCKENQCLTKNMNSSFNNKIKDNIIKRAREIKIEDDKKEKKN